MGPLPFATDIAVLDTFARRGAEEVNRPWCINAIQMLGQFREPVKDGIHSGYRKEDVAVHMERVG